MSKHGVEPVSNFGKRTDARLETLLQSDDPVTATDARLQHWLRIQADVRWAVQLLLATASTTCTARLAFSNLVTDTPENKACVPQGEVRMISSTRNGAYPV